jgi:hypothetical protein
MCYRWCKFVCEWSIIKGTLLVEQSTLLALSRHPFEEFSWNLITWIQHPSAHNFVTLVAIGLKLRALYLDRKVLCLSVTIGGNFRKLNTSNFLHMQYKRCLFASYRLIMQDTLQREQCTSSAVSRLPLEAPLRNFTHHTQHTCSTRRVSLVPIGLQLRELYLENKVSFLLYLTFHWRVRHQNSYFTISTHFLKDAQVWLRSVSSLGYITWRTKYLSGSISPYIGWSFLNVKNSQFPHARNKMRRFGRDRSGTKDTLLGEQCIFPAVSFHWKSFPENLYLLLSRMRCKPCKFCCYRAILKGTSLGKQSIFSSTSRLPIEGFSWNLTSRTPYKCASHHVSFVAIGQYWNAYYLDNKVHFPPPQLVIKRFPDSSHCAHSMHAVHIM